MIVSPFTPIFFIDRKSDLVESDYIQTFSTTDKILLELIGLPGEEVVATVLCEPSGRELYDINFNEWNINEKQKLWFTTIHLCPGYYSLYVDGIGKSEIFQITDNLEELDDTTLIQYSMKNNRQRNDAIFFIDRMQYFFDFRVPGGFKDSNWSFGVESEQFVTPHADISQLYGLESTQKKFTLGGNSGVPVWFGELFNRILVCTHVYFDGVKYSRKESSVPEIAVQADGVNSFVFTTMLQQSVNLDPVIEVTNQAIIRRAKNETYRSMETNQLRLTI